MVPNAGKMRRPPPLTAVAECSWHLSVDAGGTTELPHSDLRERFTKSVNKRTLTTKANLKSLLLRAGRRAAVPQFQTWI